MIDLTFVTTEELLRELEQRENLDFVAVAIADNNRHHTLCALSISKHLSAAKAGRYCQWAAEFLHGLNE